MKSFSQTKNQQNKSSVLLKPTIVYTYTTISSEDLFARKQFNRRILAFLLMGSGLAILLGTKFWVFPTFNNSTKPTTNNSSYSGVA